MHCCDFTFSGSNSLFHTGLNPSFSAGKSIPGHRRQVFFPKTESQNLIHQPFRSIRAEVSFNDGFISEISDASFYDLLGISKSGSLMEIKQAYKQLARKYHPDVSPAGKAEEYTKRFIRVHEAYETLSDPRRRALYDRDMVGGLQVSFSARRRYNNDERVQDKSEWQNRWEDQLSELKRRSINKDARDNVSWGARMRRQVNDKI